MPVIKCKRPKQNFQTPVNFSMAAQSKTTFYFFYRNVIVQIYAHPNGKTNGVAKWLLVMAQITVKAS